MSQRFARPAWAACVCAVAAAASAGIENAGVDGVPGPLGTAEGSTVLAGSVDAAGFGVDGAAGVWDSLGTSSALIDLSFGPSSRTLGAGLDTDTSNAVVPTPGAGVLVMVGAGLTMRRVAFGRRPRGAAGPVVQPAVTA